MSRADSGGFDLALHLSVDAIRRRLQPVVAAPSSDLVLPVANWGDLRFHLQLALSTLTVHPDTSIESAVSSVGTTFSWPAIPSPFPGDDPIAPAGTASLGLEISLVTTPKAAGTSLSMTFATKAVTVRIPPGTLEQLLVIQAWLALIHLLHGDAAREAERARIYASFENAIAAPLNAALPNSVGLGTLPSPPVQQVQLAAHGEELRALMTIGGNPGVATQITRSPIRRNASGQPLDLAGVVIGNHCLLHDLLRPVLTRGLSLAEPGFVPATPCIWFGDAPLPAAATVADIRPSLTSLMAGVDPAGMIEVNMHFEGSHSTGLFGLTGSLHLGFGAAIVATGDARSLQLSVNTSQVVGLDVWVNGWVYVAGAFLAPIAALVVGLLDASAGGSLAGAINDAVTKALGSGSLSLPLPSGGIGAPTLSMAQPDAEVETYTIPGLPFTLANPLPANDTIITFGA